MHSDLYPALQARIASHTLIREQQQRERIDIAYRYLSIAVMALSAAYLGFMVGVYAPLPLPF